MPYPRTQRARWLSALALSAAILAILPFALGVSFWHTDAPGTDATCPICHVAHVSALPETLADIAVAFVAVGTTAPAETKSGHGQPFSLIPPLRGPPA